MASNNGPFAAGSRQILPSNASEKVLRRLRQQCWCKRHTKLNCVLSGCLQKQVAERVARSSGVEVRGFSGDVRSQRVARLRCRGPRFFWWRLHTVLYSSAMSRLRRPFLSDRYFFVTVRLLKERGRLHEADFHLMALALNRARRQHPFYLTACVFLPDHWHAICAGWRRSLIFAVCGFAQRTFQDRAGSANRRVCGLRLLFWFGA